MKDISSSIPVHYPLPGVCACGHQGVRDRSFVPFAAPEPSGRPRGCSLIAPFPVMVDAVTRTGNPGRHGLFISPGPGPPGRRSRPGRGWVNDLWKPRIAGTRDPRCRIPSGRYVAWKMKEFFPQAGFWPFLYQISPSKERFVLDTLLYSHLQVLLQTPPPPRGRRRLSHSQIG